MLPRGRYLSPHSPNLSLTPLTQLIPFLQDVWVETSYADDLFQVITHEFKRFKSFTLFMWYGRWHKSITTCMQRSEENTWESMLFTMQVLGTKPGLSGLVTRALPHWATSPAREKQNNESWQLKKIPGQWKGVWTRREWTESFRASGNREETGLIYSDV